MAKEVVAHRSRNVSIARSLRESSSAPASSDLHGAIRRAELPHRPKTSAVPICIVQPAFPGQICRPTLNATGAQETNRRGGGAVEGVRGLQTSGS